MIALTISFAEPSKALSHVENTDAATSVLDLQRMVDQLLVESPDSSGRSTTNVLDMQRALLKTIRPDPPRQDEPTRQDDAVLPPNVRLYVPIAPATSRPFEAPSALEDSPVAAPAAERLPVWAGTWARYQFYLLSNAPPHQGSHAQF